MVHYVLRRNFKHINLKFWLYKLYAKQPIVTTNYHSYLITWQFNDVAHNTAWILNYRLSQISSRHRVQSNYEKWWCSTNDDVRCRHCLILWIPSPKAFRCLPIFIFFSHQVSKIYSVMYFVLVVCISTLLIIYCTLKFNNHLITHYIFSSNIWSTMKCMPFSRKIVNGLIELLNITLFCNLQAQRDDIATLKEEVAKLVQALIPSGGN